MKLPAKGMTMKRMVTWLALVVIRVVAGSAMAGEPAKVKLGVYDTRAVAGLFKPDPETQKIIADMKDQAPVPLDEIGLDGKD